MTDSSKVMGEIKKLDGDSKSRHRHHMRKNRFGRDYDFIFRQRCWNLSSCKTKNNDTLDTSRDGGFFIDMHVYSELAKKTTSAVTHSSLMEN